MATQEILVTGAAGLVGAHVVRACRAAGFRVTALDVRPLSGGSACDDDGITTLRMPTDDPRVLGDLAAGRYTAVLHQAAISDTLEDDWERLERANVTAPLALAEASARGGCAFLYASSHSVYGAVHHKAAVAEGNEYDLSVCTGPLNAYARSKLLLDERMTRTYGADSRWAALRYTNVFGGGEEHKGRMASIISQLLRTAAAGRMLTLFADTLTACRDYIPVEVVTDTLLAMIAHPVPSGVYNLGSGTAVSFAEVVQWCAEARGDEAMDVRLVPNPVASRYQYWTCADQRKLRAALPRAPICGPADVRRAAARLYDAFAAAAGKDGAAGC